MVQIRSRIHEFFNPELLKELHSICRNSIISDNNLKVTLMIDALTKHNVDFVELGPGTNRLAVLIDNYVFKLALDKAGLQDNINEFTMSQELQPYVVKTYETNELIAACEYVTVISRDEFEDYREPIRNVLAILADSYLLGDVGSVLKNFANWGYRDNGDLVILDFAYIFRVTTDQLLCSSLKCSDRQPPPILEYDENFHNLICPICRSKYTFIDIRRRIPVSQERHENNIAKQFAYLLTEPVQTFEKGYKDSDESDSEEESEYTNQHNKNNHSKEDNSMREREEMEEYTEVDEEESYLQALERLQQMKNQGHPIDEPEEEQEDPNQLPPLNIDHTDGRDYTTRNLIEIERETETEKTSIRINTQSTEPMPDLPIEELNEILRDTSDVIEQVEERVAEAIEHAVEVAEDDDQHVITSPDGETEVLVEEDHIVGPISDEVHQQVFTAPLEGFLGNVKDDEDDEEMSEEDLAMYNIMEEDVTTVRLQDVDGDGRDEIVIDTNSTEIELIDDSLPREVDQEVVAQSTVKVNDQVTITNTVKVDVESDADRLRRELGGGLPQTEEEPGDITDKDAIEELAEEYSHMQDDVDAELQNRRKGNKEWR